MEQGNPVLSEEELRRYSRQFRLSEVGVEGQKKLKAARVLLVGCGGLGSPAALYLAAAGVGQLGLVDFDSVDITNLQRQVLYSSDDVGRKKTQAAVERLSQLNPEIRIEAIDSPVTAENVLGLFKRFDIIIDGSDNFATRYLVNDACVALQKPLVFGSVLRFEGRASVFAAPHAPCYRCLFPDSPHQDDVPTCAEAGVLGVLPGMIGTIQATEALKLILGIGTTLQGRFLTVNSLHMSFKEIRVEKNEFCPACGKTGDALSLIKASQAQSSFLVCENLSEIGTDEFLKKRKSSRPVFVLDVREPDECAQFRLEGSVCIPLRELPERLPDCSLETEVLVVCQSGVRSAHAQRLLAKAGYLNVQSLRGGLSSL